MKKLLYFVFAIALSIGMFSCKKDQFTSSGKLNFSKDTILFDTIFTEVGSTTLQFKIYNNNNQKINIKEIRLMGGSNSPFRMNIDGDNADYIENVEIESEDSLFGFVEVTLSVNGSSFPMVVEDSIQFVTNGTPQYVQLRTWGQDVYVHNKRVVTSDTTWANDKPHLVYGYVYVTPNSVLNIPDGANVHFHKDALIYVEEAQIIAQGQQNSKITFQGDRLESFYDDVAGQWYGIRLVKPNEGCVFDWTIIKNGTVGIQIDTTNQGGNSVKDVVITNTEIKNQDFFGLWANAGAELLMENTLINGCNQHSVLLFAGGDYEIRQCTFGGFNTTGRQTPLFRIQNYFLGAGNTIFVRPVNTIIYNSIIYGGLNSEFNLDTLDSGAGDLISINSTIIKNETQYENIGLDIKWNTNPNFVSTNNLRPTSNEVYFGDGGNITTFDLDGATWEFAPSFPFLHSVGCYNKQ